MLLDSFSDEYFMRQALIQAQAAFDAEEVPVGAVVVFKKQIIAKAHNQTVQLSDPTAHAEMLAITSATNYVGSRYLDQCTLYVTLEPCVMCAGALFWSQVGKVVFGASDKKRGFKRLSENVLHPKTTVIRGVLEEECGTLVRDFFKMRR